MQSWATITIISIPDVLQEQPMLLPAKPLLDTQNVITMNRCLKYISISSMSYMQKEILQCILFLCLVLYYIYINFGNTLNFILVYIYTAILLISSIFRCNLECSFFSSGKWCCHIHSICLNEFNSVFLLYEYLRTEFCNVHILNVVKYW